VPGCRMLRVAAALVLVAVACGDGEGDTARDATTTAVVAADPYGGYRSDVYAQARHWLCHPDQSDVCDTNLDATVVDTDGSVEVEAPEAAADPAADCFYVYPTVSADAGDYADLEPGPEEDAAARIQAARFSTLCRVFAPNYRQLTLAGLAARLGAGDRDAAEEWFAPGYPDVLDAWKHYLANDNGGRPVVLIGHSQGAADLRRLVDEEIDGVPALQDRLVSALLLGWPVAVPDGADVGGDFDEVPICTEHGQAGCVISYSTFRATDTPQSNGLFARIEGPQRAACTNPAALDGGDAVLHPYFPTDRAGPSPFPFATSVAQPFSPGGSGPADITTPFITYPELVSAQCVRNGEFDYLAVTVNADPADPRTDDIGGDIDVPGFGLHMVDLDVAMGDLLGAVDAQIATHTGDEATSGRPRAPGPGPSRPRVLEATRQPPRRVGSLSR
jgi:hypothetical protein